MNAINFPVGLDQRVRRPSIFDEHWWFDAVCPGSWDVREISRDNQLLASFPFFTTKKLGMRYIQMPALTRTLEPAIYAPGAKAVTRLQHQTSLLQELLNTLPHFDRFELCLPPESELSLPFVQLGFVNTLTYTFRDSGQGNPRTDMEQKTRNVVVAAEKKFYVEFHHDIERFVRLSRHARSTSGDYSNYERMTRAFEACRKRDQAIIVSALGDGGSDVASAILIWDDSILYFWQSVREVRESGNGGNSLVLWKAFEFARRKGKIFDLDGFMTPQSGMFLAKFGFKPTPRTYVKNFNPLWNGLHELRSAIRPRAWGLRHR